MTDILTFLMNTFSMAKEVKRLKQLALSASLNIGRRLPICIMTATLISTSACERSEPSINNNSQSAIKPRKILAVSCKPDVNIEVLRNSTGQIEDVRIFRFDKTTLFIPTKWLGDLAATSDSSRFAGMNPVLSEDECAGVVHHLLDSDMNFGRYIDISIGVAEAHGQIVAGEAPTFVTFWKMRQNGRLGEGNDPNLKFERLISSKFQNSEDAFIPALSDVGVRLDWRPPSITEEEWRLRVRNWRAPPRLIGYPFKSNEIGAWGAVVDTPEWRNMAANVRSLVRWLSTPPAMRETNKKFFLKSHQ